MKLTQRLVFGTTYVSGSGQSGVGSTPSGAIISASDLMHMVDVSDTITDGVGSGSSFKITMGVVRSFMQIGSPNIYNIDGTLTGNRNITMSTHSIDWSGYNGIVSFNKTSIPLVFEVTSTSGWNTQLATTWSLNNFTLTDTGYIGVGIAPVTGYRMFINNTTDGCVSFSAKTTGAGSGRNYNAIFDGMGVGTGYNFGSLHRAWNNTGINIALMAEAGTNGGQATISGSYDAAIQANTQALTSSRKGVGAIILVNENNVNNSELQYGLYLSVKNGGAGGKFIGRLMDGTESAGKTLQCDNDGYCNWQGGFNSGGHVAYTNFTIVEGKITNAT